MVTNDSQNKSSDLNATITRLRGIVRREKDPVRKEQFSLLRQMVENGRPPAAIEHQLKLIAAR